MGLIFFIQLDENFWRTRFKNEMSHRIFHPEYDFDDDVMTCIKQFLSIVLGGVDVVDCHYRVLIIPAHEKEETVRF